MKIILLLNKNANRSFTNINIHLFDNKRVIYNIEILMFIYKEYYAMV